MSDVDRGPVPPPDDDDGPYTSVPNRLLALLVGADSCEHAGDYCCHDCTTQAMDDGLVMLQDPFNVAQDTGKSTGESIVCMDPDNCAREHVGGMGGTPVHLPPDGKVVPGHFDHGVPSDIPCATAGAQDTGLRDRIEALCDEWDRTNDICGRWAAPRLRATLTPDTAGEA